MPTHVHQEVTVQSQLEHLTPLIGIQKRCENGNFGSPSVSQCAAAEIDAVSSLHLRVYEHYVWVELGNILEYLFTTAFYPYYLEAGLRIQAAAQYLPRRTVLIDKQI